MKVLDLEGLGYFWTKIKNKFYIKPDNGIPKSDLSSEVQGSLNKADTALQTETDPIFTASPAHGISSEDIIYWDNKQEKLSAVKIVGNMYRTNVSGSDSISIQGNVGQFPVILEAGTYTVVTDMQSNTNSYGLSVNCGGNTYTLNTTNGYIHDSREITIPANGRWSGAVIGSVAANSMISVKIEKVVDEVTEIALVGITNDYNDLNNKPTLTNYFDGAVYDSNTKRINFKNGNVIKAYIDATAFIKDGMVDNVEIENGKLIITFNTESGKEPIELDITAIFDPSNYYDKSTIDNFLDDKANVADLATVATSGEYSDLINPPTNVSDFTNDVGYLVQADIPTNISAFTNDVGYLTEHQDISGKANISDLDNVAFSGNYSDLSNVPTNISSFINDAGYLTEHQSLSNYYTKSETDNLLDDKADTSDLATVATSGDYNDLTNKPTIPDAQIQSDWNQTDTTAKDYIKNKPNLTNNNGSLNIKPYDWYGGDINIETGFDGGNITIFGGDALYLKSGDDDIYIGGGEYTSIKLLSNTYYKNKEIAVKDDIKVTSVNGMTGAVNLSIPDDSNLVHKTDNETISGNKRFNDNIYFHGEATGEIYFNDELHESQIRLKDDGGKGWVQIVKGNGTNAITLQAALDERNNVQADWNVSDTTSYAYIKNKPTIPAAQIQADWNQTTTTSLDYIKNKPDIKTIKYGKGTIVTTNGAQHSSFGYSNNYISFQDDGNVSITSPYSTSQFRFNNKEVAVKDDIPTNVSAFTNDAGYLTSYTETDPTVPAWAKASTKPTYTAAEVGALPDTTVIPDAPGTLNTNNSTAQTVSSSESFSGTIKLHKISKTGNYNDLLNKPTIPAVDIALTNNEIDTIWNNVMN